MSFTHCAKPSERLRKYYRYVLNPSFPKHSGRHCTCMIDLILDCVEKMLSLDAADGQGFGRRHESNTCSTSFLILLSETDCLLWRSGPTTATKHSQKMDMPLEGTAKVSSKGFDFSKCWWVKRSWLRTSMSLTAWRTKLGKIHMCSALLAIQYAFHSPTTVDSLRMLLSSASGSSRMLLSSAKITSFDRRFTINPTHLKAGARSVIFKTTVWENLLFGGCPKCSITSTLGGSRAFSCISRVLPMRWMCPIACDSSRCMLPC